MHEVVAGESERYVMTKALQSIMMTRIEYFENQMRKCERKSLPSLPLSASGAVLKRMDKSSILPQPMGLLHHEDTIPSSEGEEGVEDDYNEEEAPSDEDGEGEDDDEHGLDEYVEGDDENFRD